MNDGVNQQALRIDENVPLLALDLLSCVVARRINRSPPYMGHLKSSANSWCFLFRATRTGDWVVIGRRRSTPTSQAAAADHLT